METSICNKRSMCGCCIAPHEDQQQLTPLGTQSDRRNRFLDDSPHSSPLIVMKSPSDIIYKSNSSKPRPENPFGIHSQFKMGSRISYFPG